MLDMGGNDKRYLTGPRPSSPVGRRPIGIVDLFSGCGGMTLGVMEAVRQIGRSSQVRLAVEANASIAAAYAANFAPLNGSHASRIESWFDRSPSRALSTKERATRACVGHVDILVGGPPCQGHSTLNNHTRGQDPKNALYLVMVRAAEVVEPDLVMVENVPALQRDAGRVLDQAIEGFQNLGYAVDHHVVCVADLGVPQLRKRHVLIASKHHFDISAALEASRVKQGRTVRWAIHDLIEVDGDDPRDAPSILSKENEKRAKYLLEHNLYDLPNPYRPKCQRGPHKYKSMYGRMRWDEPAQTITTGFGSPGQGRYLHPERLRALTPHEAARIQFLPDWFDFSAIPHRHGLSEAIGNAVPPKLSFALVYDALSNRVASTMRRSAMVPLAAGIG